MVMTFEALIETGRQVAADHPDMFLTRIQTIEPQDLSVLIYTSGTTGPPKGAMLTHRNCLWMGHAITTDNPMSLNDEIMSFLPLCHIFEQLFTVLGHITCGHIVNFIESPDTVAENMMEISPTVGHAVPRIWEKYFSAIQIRMADATWFKRLVFYSALKIGNKRADLKMSFKAVPFYLEAFYQLAYLAVFRKLKERMGLDRLRVAISGAAPIAPEILHFYQSIGVNLVEGYGQTEGTGVTTVSRIGRVKFGAVGQPLTGLEVKIARKKDIIVTAGGKNITPQFIENKLKASVYINDAVVIGDRRKYLTCLIMIDEDNVVKYAQDHKIQFSTYKDLTLHDDVRKLIQAEIKAVNETLARVEQVKKFCILPKKLYEEDGEVTPTMKVKRKFVNEAFCELIDTGRLESLQAWRLKDFIPAASWLPSLPASRL
jgi:long-chain acyl-CoA synthetase